MYFGRVAEIGPAKEIFARPLHPYTSLLLDSAPVPGRRIYDKPNPQLRESGLSYQVRLLSAFNDQDADLAREVMYQHMCAAHEYMEACEAELSNDFLRVPERR
jgi:ABC-type oligopeptide transport system ATPase subunit